MEFVIVKLVYKRIQALQNGPDIGVMKKYFPILAFITMFTGFLAGQVFFDVFESSAGQTSAQKKIYGHYESLLKESVFVTQKGKSIAANTVDAPIIIVNFWATWCKPCLAEFPSLSELDEKYDDNQVLIIGINTDEASASKVIDKTLKNYNLNFPVVLDQDGSWLEKFMIRAIPVSIIFYKGEVIEISNGAKDFMAAEFTEKINSLLNL